MMRLSGLAEKQSGGKAVWRNRSPAERQSGRLADTMYLKASIKREEPAGITPSGCIMKKSLISNVI